MNDLNTDTEINAQRDPLEGFHPVERLGAPDLELLHELGRGASGAVWKAKEILEPTPPSAM